MYRDSPKGRTFRLHVSHIKGARILFKKLNIEPLIEIDQKIESFSKVHPESKERMSVKYTITETGIVVIDNQAEHFVPNEDISIVWSILKKEQQIRPRRMWALLSQAHKLFPEFEEIREFIKANEKDPVKRDVWITAMYQHEASAFQGARVKGKEELTYYSLYWFPILFLKHLGLVEQRGTKDLVLTDKGNEIKDWKM